jgi:phage shock protein C
MFDAKKRGWDIDLFRSRRSRWFAGVCGGIAENMNWSPTGVRLVTAFLFIVTGSFAFFAYIAGWLLMAERPHQTFSGRVYEHEPSSNTHSSQHQDPSSYRRSNLKDKVFEKRAGAVGKIDELRDRLAHIDARIRAMETHVTSRKYQFDKEMNR